MPRVTEVNRELNSLLRDTSRSFYLTLRVLPATVRPQIGLAYLLARATDTIADTELVSVQGRLNALDSLRNRILGKTSQPLDFGELKKGCALPAEKVLLQRVEEALRILDQTPSADQQLIREVLRIITSGQEMDLHRFGERKPGPIPALETEEELDDYTYRVAGCVGEFWTRLCRARVFAKAGVDMDFLLRAGVRFGKGLQLVNVLRDVARDLRNGRCYLPRQTLASVALTPDDLLSPANMARLRPVYFKWLTAAQEHLAAGWEYTNALPPGQLRLRLACAWPILIGARTLQKLRNENVLEAERRIKVSRAELRGILARSILAYPLRRVWAKQFQREVKQTV